ncbi:MAG: ABC transporter permease [Actinobacteria bacterium ATB1]|nr:ABC transporter permease [Actinobacteria bacterium ATB1]
MTEAAVANVSSRGRPRFWRDTSFVAQRALRDAWRDPEGVIPALVIGSFFFLVNVGQFGAIAEGVNIKAFQLPVAVLFAITGLSRAQSLVLDIRDGYFDRLLVTPIHRGALLIGLMTADMVIAVVLGCLILVIALVAGSGFAAGIVGLLVFIAYAALWAIAYNGFPYAIALRTGNPAAVNSSFLLFFPFLFLTTVYVPKEALTGWMKTVVTWNPVTYLLEGMRSLVVVGWDADALLWGLLAILGVAILSQSLAFAALRGRVSRG